jgi:hypothetical protein
MFCELERTKRGGADQERESIYERSEINGRDSGSSPVVRNACFVVVAICSLGAGSNRASGTLWVDASGGRANELDYKLCEII